jgi:uncharacterized protein (TIGR00369 family)
MDAAVKTMAAVEADAVTDHESRAAQSAFRSLLGLRIVEWQPDVCVVEIPIRNALRNFSGAAAGPVVAAAVDMAATLAGCYMPGPGPTRRAVTLSLTVSFVAPGTGGIIRARGVKIGGGNSIFTSTVAVTDGSGLTLATGQGTFRYVTLKKVA